MMLKRKLLGNNLGFSLVEALVTVSVISIISLVLTNQSKMVSKSRTVNSSNAVVNELRSKLVTALADEATCTANFKPKPITLTNYTSIKDSEGAFIIETNASNSAAVYGARVGNIAKSDANSDNVKVQSITTVIDPNNNDQIILSVKFLKLNAGVGSTFGASEQLDLNLNVFTNAGAITNCFADATLSIQTIVALSCTGNTALYNPNLNPPYGQCDHSVIGDPAPATPTHCPKGQFIKRVGVNLLNRAVGTPNSTAIEYECVALESYCPANQIVISTTADGKVNCGYPFPVCAAGQIMVKSAGGSYICASTQIGCSGLNAVKSINSDGSVTCGLFNPPQTCVGTFINSTSPGTISCSANVAAITCPYGKFVDSFDASGNPICTPWVNLPFNCPAGQGIKSIDASGNFVCQPFDLPTSCMGVITSSPTTHTFNSCVAAGGVVENRNYITSGTNLPDSYCHFNGSVCPGTWQPCNSRLYTVNNSCTDSNSACISSVALYPLQTRYAWGNYLFQGPYAPNSMTCVQWWKDMGPWVRSCHSTTSPPVYATTTQVGCY